jgi:HSP20 family protein
MMRRSNPFEEIERMFERMNRQFEEMNRSYEGRLPTMDRTGGVSLDVAEYDDEIVVVADLPGFDREDIDLTVVDDRLTIRAERSGEEEAHAGEWVRRERRHQSVSRSVSLPAAVDEDRASASYANGVLTVTLPRVESVDEDEGHHIDVN